MIFSRLVKGIRRRIHKSGIPGCPPIEQDPSLIVPFSFPTTAPDEFRVGAMIHMFHPVLAGEFAQLLRNLGPAAKLMITTDTEAKRAEIGRAFAAWPADAVEVRVVINKGRDIAPKLIAFTDRYGEFDLILFLHSKLTDYSPDGAGWRDKLLNGLCGSPEIVRSVLTIFALAPDTGMVFPQHHEPVRKYTGWEYSFPYARRLAARIGVRLNRRGVMDFPSGSMFWARPAALAPLLGLGLTMDDFPAEGWTTPTTVAHAVERLFALAAELAGFAWYKIAAPEFYLQRDSMISPRTAEELQAWLAAHRPTLRRTMVRGHGEWRR